MLNVLNTDLTPVSGILARCGVWHVEFRKWCKKRSQQFRRKKRV